MPAASQTTAGPLGGPIQALFGSDKPPKEVFQRYVRPLLPKLRDIGKQALSSLSRGGAEAERQYNLGTERQRGLMAEQEGVGRQLLSRALNFDPNQQLSDIGKTLFGFIGPNVLDPAARHAANAYTLTARARGFNPAAVDSTTERLRRAAESNRVYLQSAGQAFNALPQLYNQATNAGLNYEDLARGYLPSVMRGWRNLDTAPLEAARLMSGASSDAARNVMEQSQANRMATYGFQQPQNWADRFGEADAAAYATMKDALQTAASLYAQMGGGQGGGGMPAGSTAAGAVPQTGAGLSGRVGTGSTSSVFNSPYFA